MKKFALALLAIALGLGASELLYRAPGFHEMLARFLPQSDAARLARNLREAARGEVISEEAIAREMEILHAQLPAPEAFAGALREANLSEEKLRAEVTENLRARIWLEKQIDTSVSDDEVHVALDAAATSFNVPQRFHARHIFLAAPDGSPPQVMAEKQSTIQGIAIRLLSGEKFEELAAETSEDEATKKSAGDLGFFSAQRMPPEFMAEVEKLQAGEQSAPFRSHLGFHIVQLLEVKPAEKIPEALARAEIKVSLGNVKRALAVTRLTEQLRQP